MGYYYETTDWLSNPFADIELGMFDEAVNVNGYAIKELIYPKIEEVLSTPSGDMKYRRLIQLYMDKNSEALHQAGPSILIPFTDAEKDKYFTLFNMSTTELKKIIKDITDNIESRGNWLLIRQNPIYAVIYCCIRFYHIQPPSKMRDSGLAISLTLYALAEYPSIHSKYFKQGGANADLMNYVIDQATEKFTVKKSGNIINMLNASINSAYDFLGKSMTNMSDADFIRFVQRVRNDQNSLIKNITKMYMKEYNKGTSVSMMRQEFSDGGETVQNLDNQTNSTIVYTVSRSIVNSISTSGLDLSRVSAAAKASDISMSELRFYLSRIMLQPEMPNIEKLIYAVLYEFLYTDHHRTNEINTSVFLGWSLQLFGRSNSMNPNIVVIKDILNQWSEEYGIYKRYKREASRVAYKKAIYLYHIFLIQKFNN